MKKQIADYTRIYNLYVNELFSYGIGLGFAANKCKDAIHDVFCKMVTGANDLSEIKNIRFYLLRSLKNRLLDMEKRERRMTYDPMEEHVFHAEVSVTDLLVEGEERDRLAERVQKLLDSLTNNQREAIYLRYIQEMDYEEIAALLDISAEYARKLVYRGMLKLREENVGTLGFLIFMTILIYYPPPPP